MNLKFGMFIHFSINTYYDAEWSDGTLNPSKFNPTELDTDRWCQVAVAAGMKYIVVNTKHHDGFCLWPTQYTDYSIKATPFKDDYLARVVNSAAKYGLKLGIYYSLWDRHEKSHDTDEFAYVEFMKNQLKELLTGYGDLVELWFDGFWKKQQSGWEKPLKNEAEEMVHGTAEAMAREDRFIQAWRSEGAYRWQMDHLYQYVKSLQPNCIVMNNSTTAYPGVPLHPVDARTGEKLTQSNFHDRKIWPWLGREIYLPLQIETTMSVKGNDQFPNGNWFWHEWDHSVMTPSQIKNLQKIAQQMDANLLLNVIITDKGKLRKEDEWTLLHLHD
ncbi:MAG: alpha-L-fucosidase [candidate division KSB1 bacterium]|nr:alpha-L-fucosidase [candidate division KSB1 bacterium]